MRKFLLLFLIFMLILSSFPAFAVNDYITVIIDGKELVPTDVNGNIVRPMLQNGTTYLPVRAIANALHLSIEWDDVTKSVFINGVADAQKSDVVNVYINGTKLIPTDVNGNIVHPILKNGTTYLPIRAISEQFNKTVSWEQSTHTVILTTPSQNNFAEEKTYAIINKASLKAVTATNSGLEILDYQMLSNQAFRFIKTETDGYYHIQSVANQENFDVNGNSKNPGASIITYNAGSADNQMFAFEKMVDDVFSDEGYIIYSKSSLLPIEDSAGRLKQNVRRDSAVQAWLIIELEDIKEQPSAIYRTLKCGDYSLTDADCTAWLFTANEDCEYIITNRDTNKSLDVANQSKASGDPIITYETSGDANQRWTLEKNSDGTYLVKSVHSNLYLSVSGNNIIQSDAKQNWTIEIIK